jgi:4-alpha-glucanotransferase
VLALWEQVRAALLSISTHDGPVLTSWYARVMYTTSLAFVAFILTILLNQPAPDIVYKAF